MPCNDLPDMLTSPLKRDSVSLCIRQPGMMLPAHFLWINSCAAGGNTEQRWAERAHTYSTHQPPPPLTVPPSPWERPYKTHGRAQWVEASLNLLLSHGVALLMEHTVQLPLPKYSHPPLRWDEHFLVDLMAHILHLKKMCGCHFCIKSPFEACYWLYIIKMRVNIVFIFCLKFRFEKLFYFT